MKRFCDIQLQFLLDNNNPRVRGNSKSMIEKQETLHKHWSTLRKATFTAGVVGLTGTGFCILKMTMELKKQDLTKLLVWQKRRLIFQGFTITMFSMGLIMSLFKQHEDIFWNIISRKNTKNDSENNP